MRTATALLACLAFAAAAAASDRPRLVLVISVDQLRGDYVSRFGHLYLPPKIRNGVGGFRWLAERGANYTNAHHAHVPTATAPGHAAILTGCGPAVNGIAGNQWYDRDQGRIVYCVADPAVRTVGGSSPPMSARNLLSTTVGDELKMATNGRAKVVGIAFKDRAAILMAGHAADTVIWFDGQGWVTSTYYAERLPAWVEAWNARKLPQADADKVWTPLLRPDAYAFSRPKPGAKAGSPLFSHAAKEDWIGSPFGQEHLFATLKEAIRHERLGQDEVPDLLAVNLSTNDYVGHAYGPNSPEVLDISVRTDRLLSDLFNHLDRAVPGGLERITIVLTGDHGVVAVPEEAKDAFRLPARRVSPSEIRNAAEAALDREYGEGDWVAAYVEGNLYLNPKTVEQRVAEEVNLLDIQESAAEAIRKLEPVQYAFEAFSLTHNLLPGWDWARIVARSYNRRLSGDVVVALRPGYYPSEGTTTGHFSPWPYDTHVPILLAGFGIKRGTHARRAEVPSIAATLCQILGLEFPSGCSADPLHEALGR